LGRANRRATPTVVGRIEEFNPHLRCKETDQGFWRAAVESNFRQRNGLAPFPQLKKQLKAKLRVVQTLEENDEDSVKNVASALQELDRFPISIALLEKYQAARIIGSLRSSSNEDLAMKAKQLLKKWKTEIKAYSTKTFQDEAARKRDPQGHIEEASACHSWRDLYQCMKDFDECRMQSFGKKSRNLYDVEKSQKAAIKSGVAFMGERKSRSQQVKLNFSAKIPTFTKCSPAANKNQMSRISQLKSDFASQRKLATAAFAHRKNDSSVTTGKSGAGVGGKKRQMCVLDAVPLRHQKQKR